MRSVDNPSHVRAELIRLVARTLAPLYPGEGIEALLPDWLAGITTQKLVASMRCTPDATAAALADALVIDTAAACPAEAIVDLVATEFPRLGPTERAQLARFTRILRELAIEHGGQVEAVHLRGEGFSAGLAALLLPKAEHLLKVLAGEVRGVAGRDYRSAAEYLREVGTRAAVRHCFASAAA